MVPMVPIINLEFFLITNWRINKQETNNLTFFGEFELYLRFFSDLKTDKFSDLKTEIFSYLKTDIFSDLITDICDIFSDLITDICDFFIELSNLISLVIFFF